MKSYRVCFMQSSENQLPITTLVSLSRLASILALLLALLLGGFNSDAMSTENSRTDVRYYPSDRNIRFNISADQPASEIISVLQQMFDLREHLGISFSCHRYGSNNSNNHLSCLAIKRDDVVEVRFDSDSNTLTLSLRVRPPANLDKTYSPDYLLFERLSGQVLDLITNRFGADKVRK